MKQILLIVILTILLGDRLPIIKNTNLSTNPIKEDLKATDEKYKLLGSIESKDIFLYGKEADYGYDGMILEIGNKKKYTDWRSTFNIMNHPPKLIIADIDNNGVDELIIIITEGYGTGIHEENLIILDVKTMNELTMMDTIDNITRNVRSKLTKESIRIEIGEQVYLLNTKDYTNHTENLYKNIEYGSEIYYDVNINKLQAKVSAQINHGAYIGYIIMNYKYDDNQFMIDNIKFIQN